MRSFLVSGFIAMAVMLGVTTPACAQADQRPEMGLRPSQVTELGQCVILSSFDSADIQRQETPGSSNPDRIFYDLATWEVKQLRLLVTDAWGKPVYSEDLFRCTPQTKHFEISETQGNEFTLGKQIRYFLKQQELYRCPAQVRCFATR